MKVDKESKLRAKLNAEYGEEIVEIAIKWLGSFEFAAAMFRENQFDGIWANVGDWAINMLNETGDLHGLSDLLQSYFDFDGFARDCVLGGDIYAETLRSGEVAVFYSRFRGGR